MSRRQYITQADIEKFSDIQVIDSVEADDQMSYAEGMVDAYVGFQAKHISRSHSGVATSGGSNYLIDSSGDSPLKNRDDDFFTFCEIKIIGGTGSGQTRTVISSDEDLCKVIVSENWTTNPDNTSFYVIQQLGKFPRIDDVFRDDTGKYYKTIPDAVKMATLAQLEYIIQKGSDFFANAIDYESERLEGYSYVSKAGKNKFISPHARNLLKGIANRKGRLLI